MKFVKAIFIDECAIDSTVERWVKDLHKKVPIIWAASTASTQDSDLKDFTTIHLTKNLRNSKEIILEAKKLQRKTYSYTKEV